jgi:Ca2+:H+ antiporter
MSTIVETSEIMSPRTRLAIAVREEWFLPVGIATGVVFLGPGRELTGGIASPTGLTLLSLWLFAMVLGCCLSVVRHADHLAIRLPEPYGTLILTLAVTTIEVMSMTAMMSHGHNPALVRDTIFAVVMILLNGLVGASLLLGAWRHVEQQYNLQGANAYLGVIIPVTVLCLVLPNFTLATAGPTLSPVQEVFVAAASVGLYLSFLAVQTIRHRSYFVLGDPNEIGGHETPACTSRHPAVHVVLLAVYMVPLVYLAEQLGRPVNVLLDALQAPPAIGGAVIAFLVATPEAVSAVRAAAANRLQRSMNISLGSVISTIGLTIPAMIAISWLRGEHIVLGLDSANAVLLILTLTVCLVTFASGRTNVLQGAIHLVLFATYGLLLLG